MSGPATVLTGIDGGRHRQVPMADDDAARRLDVGRQMARWRQRRGLTRQQFADLCGRSLSWVDKIERGERALLRLPMLERVAEVLNVPVDVLTKPEQARVAASTCLDAFEVLAIREALQRYDAITTVLRSPASADSPADMSRVRQQVAYATSPGWLPNERWCSPRLLVIRCSLVMQPAASLNLIADLQRQGPGQPPLSLRQLAARAGLGTAS